MLFSDGPHLRHDLLPGMFKLRNEVVDRRRKANQQWFLKAGVAALPLPPKASGQQ